ncbi:MAG: hypothetical protein EOP45_02300 [Sphingobacteriaceae bacterium]|nr:MAG: hypothetical protein EOP45_02300 [Sphingobacteriaceae bacterium]
MIDEFQHFCFTYFYVSSHFCSYGNVYWLTLECCHEKLANDLEKVLNWPMVLIGQWSEKMLKMANDVCVGLAKKWPMVFLWV